MSTIYELTGSYKTLYEMAANGEIDEQTFSDTLEAMDFDAEFEVKADGYAKVIKQLTADAAAIKEEKKRLDDRIKSIENATKRCRERLRDAMKVTGKEKFKTLLFSFSIRKNSLSLVIDSDAKIPKEFLIPQDPTIDKEALKKAVKSGVEIDGVSVRQGESLVIG